MIRGAPSLFFVLLLLGAAPTCARSGDEAAPAEAPAEKPAAREAPPACQSTALPQRGLDTGAVVVEADGGPARFVVELCQTPRQRQIGMMCRTSLERDRGMLFLFERERPRSFWMKNTLVPLDMIFADDEGRIVAVIESATPLTTESRASRAPAKYVLELAGGTAARLGVRPGQWLRFEDIPGHPTGLPPTSPGEDRSPR